VLWLSAGSPILLELLLSLNLIFSNNKFINKLLKFLHIVCFINRIIPIKGPSWPNTLLLDAVDTTVLIIPNPGIINI